MARHCHRPGPRPCPAGVLGDDSLSGGADQDTLLGDQGNDRLQGDAGNDTLFGGANNDSLFGGAGADSLAGGAGHDSVDYNGSTQGVTVRLWNGTGIGGDAQGDRLVSIERVIGTGQTDVLIGSAGNDTLEGGGGNDFFNGAAGADRFDGGAAADTVSYDSSGQGVIVRLWANTATGGDAQGDTFASIENLTGSNHGDVLSGTDTDGNTIQGGGGGDYLYGRGGADRLDGGAGNDLLSGGAAADQFVFAAGYGQDWVEAFEDGIDRVDLVGLVFADFTETAIAGGVRLTRTGTPTDIIDLMGVTTAQIDAGDFI